MTDFPALPDCLKVGSDHQANWLAAWKGKRPMWTRDMRFTKPDKVEEAVTRKLRRELEAQKKAKRDERFKVLRANHSGKKRIKLRKTPRRGN